MSANHFNDEERAAWSEGESFVRLWTDAKDRGALDLAIIYGRSAIERRQKALSSATNRLLREAAQILGTELGIE